jgi:NAD+ kinase
MSETMPIPHSIAIAANPDMPEAVQESRLIADCVRANGGVAWLGLLSDESLDSRLARGEFDLLIALGGDGSMLKAGHLCGPVEVPIMGVNLGRLGFLMETRRDEWGERLSQLFKGDYWLEKRMMLRAEIWRGADLLGSWDVVNEAVVSRGQVMRPVRITACVDDIYLTTYVADGLIASTPTGSTGYALAVGGPVLPPELRNFLIIPVAPHLSMDRGVVVAEGSSASMTVHTTHQAVFSVDGQPPISLADGDTVRVAAGEHTLYFVHFQDAGYFYRNLTSHMDQNPSTGVP